LGIALLALVALAVAGYVGSVVGPHFKKASASSSTTTTSAHAAASSTTSTVAHSSVKVVVANGTQQANTAGHFAQLLQLQGWNVAAPQNTTAAAATTTVFYAPSQQPAATLIASEIGAPATAVQPLSASVPVANTTGVNVVVVIGSDLAGSGFPATTAPTATTATTAPAT
jgi:hypothetical protein